MRLLSDMTDWLLDAVAQWDNGACPIPRPRVRYAPGDLKQFLEAQFHAAAEAGGPSDGFVLHVEAPVICTWQGPGLQVWRLVPPPAPCPDLPPSDLVGLRLGLEAAFHRQEWQHQRGAQATAGERARAQWGMADGSPARGGSDPAVPAEPVWLQGLALLPSTSVRHVRQAQGPEAGACSLIDPVIDHHQFFPWLLHADPPNGGCAPSGAIRMAWSPDAPPGRVVGCLSVLRRSVVEVGAGQYRAFVGGGLFRRASGAGMPSRLVWERVERAPERRRCRGETRVDVEYPLSPSTPAGPRAAALGFTPGDAPVATARLHSHSASPTAPPAISPQTTTHTTASNTPLASLHYIGRVSDQSGSGRTVHRHVRYWLLCAPEHVELQEQGQGLQQDQETSQGQAQREGSRWLPRCGQPGPYIGGGENCSDWGGRRSCTTTTPRQTRWHTISPDLQLRDGSQEHCEALYQPSECVRSWTSSARWLPRSTGSYARPQIKPASEAAEWGSASEAAEWGSASEAAEWGSASEAGGDAEWGSATEAAEWGSASEAGGDAEWGSATEAGDNAEWKAE